MLSPQAEPATSLAPRSWSEWLPSSRQQAYSSLALCFAGDNRLIRHCLIGIAGQRGIHLLIRNANVEPRPSIVGFSPDEKLQSEIALVDVLPRTAAEPTSSGTAISHKVTVCLKLLFRPYADTRYQRGGSIASVCPLHYEFVA